MSPSPTEFVRSCTMLSTAVELLPKTSPRTLRRNDRQNGLSHFSGLASDATTLSIYTGKGVSEILRLLELERGVMATTYMEARSDIVEPSNAYPSKFKSLRDEFNLANFDIDNNLESHRAQTTRIARTY